MRHGVLAVIAVLLAPGCLLGWTPPTRYAAEDGTYAVSTADAIWGRDAHADLFELEYFLVDLTNQDDGAELAALLTLGATATVGGVSQLDCEYVQDLDSSRVGPKRSFEYSDSSWTFLTLVPGESVVLSSAYLYFEFDDPGGPMTYLQLAGEVDVEPLVETLGHHPCDDDDVQCDDCNDIDADTCIWVDIQSETPSSRLVDFAFDADPTCG